MPTNQACSIAFAVAMTFVGCGTTAAATPTDVLNNWYTLMLELVRHTATYSPPYAARTFGYVGVTAYEATVTGSDNLTTLAGQLNGLTTVPDREPGQQYDEGVILDAALADTVEEYFGNTGPTGRRAVAAARKKWRALAVEGVAGDIVARSEAYGKSVAAHIIEWSQDDGGAVIVNMGFPLNYELPRGDDKWVPTSTIAQQQSPLLPEWGNNRTFAMPNGATCPLPPPPAFSIDPASAFYKEADEVYQTGKSITPEQRAIARFWSDDPMLTMTPPGHWFSIAQQVLKSRTSSLEDSVDLLARLGVAEADAFIGCWNAKYEYDLIRPISYIRKHIDPKWEPALNTPPFPEYPSGHSTASGAAAAVLSAYFGDAYAFEDATGGEEGHQKRKFPSFAAAADEAGISRLYGGIHFRSAIDLGLEQGRCIGAYAVALRTRK